MRPDVGLGGGISHGVVADPSRQVDVEGAGINDAICIHQTLFSQLQKNGKNGGHSERAVGETHSCWETRALYPLFQQTAEYPWLDSAPSPTRTPLMSFKTHLLGDAITSVFTANTRFCRWPRNRLNQLNLNAKRDCLQPRRVMNNLEKHIYRRGGVGGNLASIPIHVCV